MLVDHETYGRGRITEVSGHGAMRKLKIRFSERRTGLHRGQGEIDDCQQGRSMTLAKTL